VQPPLRFDCADPAFERRFARSALVVFFGLFLGATMGCRKRDDPKRLPQNESPAASPSMKAPVASGATSPKVDMAAPVGSTEKGASKDFESAMAAGRAATHAKRYPEAIAAFQRAQNAQGMTTRASSELGYAQLLAGQADGARRTLTAAWDDAFETRLRAEIAYNLGLAAEALHEPDKALAWFFDSQSLRPTKAAEAKIQGKAFCPVEIDSKPVPATEHASLLAAIADLRLDLGDAVTPPKTEAEAKKLLCAENDCSTISIGPPDEGGPWSNERRLTRAIGNRWRVSDAYFTDARPGWSMVCHQSAVVSTKREGALWHVVSGGTSYVKGLGTDKGEHCAAESEQCSEDCFVTDFWRTDAYYDAATLTRLVKVTQRTPADRTAAVASDCLRRVSRETICLSKQWTMPFSTIR
jgi:tetratricopeptide (TPR) repeat protein